MEIKTLLSRNILTLSSTKKPGSLLLTFQRKGAGAQPKKDGTYSILIFFTVMD